MNALDPIRHAYGEAAGAPPAPGEPGHAEHRLLQSTREVLDRMPRPRPDAAVLDAVAAAARDATALVPLRAAFGETPPPASDAPGHAEYVLLQSTLAALDTLPPARPDAATLDAVKAAATAHALRPVQAAYGEAEPPAADDPQHAEYALLQSTRDVLDRTPKPRPDAGVIAALAAAAKQSAVPPPPTVAPLAPVRPVASRPAAPRPAADRPARILPFGRLPAWVGTAAMLIVVASVGIWMLNERPPEGAAPERTAEAQAEPDAQDAAPPEGAAAPDMAALSPAPPAESFAQAAPPAPLSPAPANAPAPRAAPSPRLSAGAGRGEGTRPRAVVPPPPPVSNEPFDAAAAVVQGEQTTRATVASRSADEAAPGAWESGEDVRLLSLRLQQIAETSEGLGWSAPPAPFGEAGSGEPLEGVRADAPPGRVEVRMRTTPSGRSSGQMPRR